MPKRKSGFRGTVAQAASQIKKTDTPKEITSKINLLVCNLYAAKSKDEDISQHLSEFQEYITYIKSDPNIKQGLFEYFTNPNSDTFLKIDGDENKILQFNALHISLSYAMDPEITSSLIELGFLTTKGRITVGSKFEYGTALQYAYQKYVNPLESRQEDSNARINLEIVTRELALELKTKEQAYVPNESETAIFHRLSVRFNDQTSKILQSLNSIDPKWKDFQHPQLYHGKTALMTALNNSKFAYAQNLLHLGASTTAKDSLGENALFSISRAQHQFIDDPEKIQELKKYELELFQEIYQSHNWEDEIEWSDKIKLLAILGEGKKIHLKVFLATQTDFMISATQEHYDTLVQDFREGSDSCPKVLSGAKHRLHEAIKERYYTESSSIDMVEALEFLSPIHQDDNPLDPTPRQKITNLLTQSGYHRMQNSQGSAVQRQQPPTIIGVFDEELTEEQVQAKLEGLGKGLPEGKFEVKYTKDGKTQIHMQPPSKIFTNATSSEFAAQPSPSVAPKKEPEANIKNVIEALIGNNTDQQTK